MGSGRCHIWVDSSEKEYGYGKGVMIMSLEVAYRRRGTSALVPYNGMRRRGMKDGRVEAEVKVACEHSRGNQGSEQILSTSHLKCGYADVYRRWSFSWYELVSLTTGTEVRALH